MKKMIRNALLAILGLAVVSCSNTKAESADASVAEETDAGIAEVIDPANEKLPFEIRDNFIYNENVPVVVDFYADWCGPCKTYAPTFEAVAEKFQADAFFVSLNADEYPNLCNTYEINSIPTTLFIMPGGSVMGKEVGVLTMQQLEMYVNQLIETSAGIDMEL